MLHGCALVKRHRLKMEMTTQRPGLSTRVCWCCRMPIQPLSLPENALLSSGTVHIKPQRTCRRNRCGQPPNCCCDVMPAGTRAARGGGATTTTSSPATTTRRCSKEPLSAARADSRKAKQQPAAAANSSDDDDASQRPQRADQAQQRGAFMLCVCEVWLLQIDAGYQHTSLLQL